MQAAKEKISSGLSAKAVCEECGFTDYSSFYRAFKGDYGISPRQFRKLQEKEEAGKRKPVDGE